MTMATARKGAWWDPRWSWKVWALVGVLLLPTFGFALWVLAEAGGQTKIDPAVFKLATRDAGSTITAITGTEHTVYHANAPLPGASSPRKDGRLTLVWFTTTSCRACEAQAAFTYRVMDRDDVVFMEKELGREPAAEPLGVREAPTFVWLDAQGTELGRFTAAPDEAAFRAEVAKVAPERQ